MTEPTKKIKFEYINNPEQHSKNNNLSDAIKDVLQSISQNSKEAENNPTTQLRMKKEIILAEPDFSQIMNEKSSSGSTQSFSDENHMVTSLESSVNDSSLRRNDSLLPRNITDPNTLMESIINRTIANTNGIRPTYSKPIQLNTEEERNADKRERNKLAARRCRKRKMDKIAELKEAVSEMGKYFQQIKNAVQNKQANDINLAKLDDLIHLSKAVVDSDSANGTKYILSTIQAANHEKSFVNEIQSPKSSSRRNSSTGNNIAAAISPETVKKMSKSQVIHLGRKNSSDLEQNNTSTCSLASLLSSNEKISDQSSNRAKIVRILGNNPSRGSSIVEHFKALQGQKSPTEQIVIPFKSSKSNEGILQVHSQVKPNLLEMLASNLNRS